MVVVREVGREEVDEDLIMTHYMHTWNSQTINNNNKSQIKLKKYLALKIISCS